MSFYRLLLEKQKRYEIPLFGFAGISEWENEKEYPVPPEFYPASIYPEAKTAIVIGVPVILPILETTPSIYYNEHYRVLNAHLDSEALKLSFYLNDHFALTIPTPRDGYSGMAALKKDPTGAFSHKHAAYHAGLGAFGRNNTLLTPKYGPRVRFTTILTSASLNELGVPEETAIKTAEMKKRKLCIECMACARHCPAGAISNDKTQPYPKSKINKMNCVDYSGELGAKGVAPCGVCIKVCPVGDDRKHFRREKIQIYGENAPNTDENRKITESWAHIRRYGTK